MSTEIRINSELAAECEALKAERDALAVENAALKDAITTHSQSTHFCELCGKDDPCSTDDVCYALNETPATDAALAAIQAQGVEKAAAALDALSAQSASATTQGNFRAAAVYLRTTVLPAIGEAK
ncbi:TPA: hypothetical protein SLN25_001456 [Serratia marcescens]|nr:hypothetical protein [Serratia marcescens]